MYAPAHPAIIGFLGDCVNGGANCRTGPNLNLADDANHGTSSAGIISANDKQGDAYRGVTPIVLDSWKVYVTPPPGGKPGFDYAAALRAYQNAVVHDRVIAAVFWSSGDDTSPISQAADNAFDAGVATIAGNGNFGPGISTVVSPASAHKAIGVGSVGVLYLQTEVPQGRGPTRDARIKPDIQAPTSTETASAASDSDRQDYSGTSGATPYAAGAAALARLFLRSLQPLSSPAIEPGQLYAYLILSGQNRASNFRPDNTSGAGLLRLPSDGMVFCGKVSITQGARIDIPLDIDKRWYFLDGALWWDENIPVAGTEVHNDIDLSLVDPSGAEVAWSISVSGVFEKARFGIGVIMDSGVWTLRIKGYSVPGGSQRVYWAAHAK
jgi:hypothetical protein